MLSIYFIHENGAMLSRRVLYAAPRVGDEIRLPGERYFRVTLVVWVLDEYECPYQRVNVGVADAAIAKDAP
jgi:hypothetical protein